MHSIRNLVIFALTAFALSQPSVAADKTQKTKGKSRIVIQAPDSPSLIWLATIGGRGYDNWATLSRTKLPQRTHPSYPKSGKKKGAVTWLCPTCHGWDYRGKDGAYGRGENYTGIKGLEGARGKDPDLVFSDIRSGVHVFPKNLLPDKVVERIAYFISQAQYNAQYIIDTNTGKALKGDPVIGKAHFQNMCAVCHGFDGKARNLGSKAKPRYLGTVARDDPWAFMHKLRNGAPGKPMIALMSMPMQVLEDVLAYAQKDLPVR